MTLLMSRRHAAAAAAQPVHQFAADRLAVAK